MTHIDLQLCPKERPFLETSGLASFEDLMFKKKGRLLSDEKYAQMFRLELKSSHGVKTLFLKRTIGHRRRKNLQSLLQFNWPHTDVYREMRLVQKLRDVGIPTMRVMAWGEERKLGLPVRGFILVEGVPGRLLHDMFLDGDVKTRKRIVDAFGRFVAQLHALGFFQIVRLKDLICSNPEDLSLTLIDRAASKFSRKFFWQRFCLQSLRRGFRRMKRDGIVFGAELEEIFCAAYAGKVADKWKISPRDLQSRLRAK